MAIIPFQKKKSRARCFEQCVQPHLSGMYRFAYRLTGKQEDAEDLVQDVLTRVYPKAEELFRVEKPGAWLNQVLYRHFIDLTRKRSWQAERVVADMASEDYAQDFFDTLLCSDVRPEATIDDQKLREAVAGALDRLAPDERSLVLLHDVDGWKQEDIGAVLDIAIGTVKSRLHRCRKKLREELAAEMEPFLVDLRLRD